MRQSKAKEFYRDLLNEDELMRYYRGRFATRNDIIVEHVLKLLPAEASVIDLAAGSSYIAEALLKDSRVRGYNWNDFNPRLQSLVRRRVEDDRMTISSFDVDADDYCVAGYNVFICVSMEHLEKDCQALEKLDSGCVVSICSPDLEDPAHVRSFKSLAEMEDRYSSLIDIRIRQEHRDGVPKFILSGYKR